MWTRFPGQLGTDFGHVHQDGGFWREEGLCFANVTTWECERGPTVVDLDAASGRVCE